MKSATCSKSDTVNPLDVNAGDPSLIPPGLKAFLSPGTVFLLAVIEHMSSTWSTRFPSIPAKDDEY